jgi:hypothetical protein
MQLNSEQFELKEINKLDGKKTQQGRGFSINSSYCEVYKKEQKKNGIYCPEIRKAIKTSRGGLATEVLEIQVSLPKLIYGGGFFDTDFNDLEKIYSKLLSCLNDLGISTSKDELRHAIIRRADFSKIIRLPPYLGQANQVIYALSKFDYKPSSDFNFHKFNDSTGGAYIKFYNSTQGYVIYDKMGEILNNGYTDLERNVIERFKAGKLKRGALRFELSLQRKDSFEAIVRRYIKNKKKDFYLEEILSEDLAKAVLLNAFDKVFNNIALGLLTLSEMEDNRLRAYLDNSTISIKKQQNLYYWVRMATNIGISGTWEQIRLKYKGGSVDRCKKEVSLILQELGKIDGNTPNLIAYLRSEHKKFEIIKGKTD